MCKPYPQLTPAMVVVANMLYRIEPRVLRRLNACLEARGLGHFNHVSSAISRARNKYTSAAEAKDIMEALREALEPLRDAAVGEDGAALEEVLQEWLQAVEWQRIRERCTATEHEVGALH